MLESGDGVSWSFIMRSRLFTSAVLAFCLVAGVAASPLHEAASRGDTTEIAALLAAGADPNAPEGQYGLTPLHMAAYESQTAAIEVLLEAGSDPNARDSRGITPLFASSFAGPLAAIKVLLAAGADPNVRTGKGATPLHRLAYTGQTDAIRTLLSAGADMNVQTGKGTTPLHAAVQGNAPRSFGILLDAGAAPTVKNREGATALDLVALAPEADAFVAHFGFGLHSAAERGQLEVVEALLAAGADPGYQPQTWAGIAFTAGTPLYEAAARGHRSVVTALLSAGVDPRTGGKRWDTPLHGAARGGHADVIRLLLAAGADLYPQDTCKPCSVGTPLHVAASHGHIEAIEVLIEAGADPDTPVRSNRSSYIGSAPLPPLGMMASRATPLHMASNSERIGALTVLLDAGADPNAEAKHGHTPLSVASVSGNAKAITTLLARGAQISDKGGLLLVLAARANGVDAIDTLLAAGIDPNSKYRGMTALHAAGDKGYAAVVEALLAAGADPNSQHANCRFFGLSCSDGLSPLHEAAYGSVTELYTDGTRHTGPSRTEHGTDYAGTVSALLSGGADPDLRDSLGRTPEQIAAARGHVAAYDVLTKWGFIDRVGVMLRSIWE